MKTKEGKAIEKSIAKLRKYFSEMGTDKDWKCKHCKHFMKQWHGRWADTVICYKPKCGCEL